MRQWIALIALVITIDQLRSAECRVACRFTGTEGGIYWKANCYCFNVVDYSEIVNRQRIYLPKKSRGHSLVPSSYSEPAAVVPSGHESEKYRGYPKELDEFLF